MIQKEKYTYLVGPYDGYCLNEKELDYDEVITEVNILIDKIHKKIFKLMERKEYEEIEDLLFFYNPIKIYKELVDYKNDEPISGTLIECIKTIELK